MHNMHIIGAGMAGLLAGHALRRHCPVIVEAQEGLPHNHEALLRFRSGAVSEITGIPFRAGIVRKAVVSNGAFAYHPNPNLANLYSRKVTGAVLPRSIWNLDEAVRYVAPPQLIQLMAAGLTIGFGEELTSLNDLKRLAERGPVVSTIPMPTMMKMVGWNDAPEFEARPIWSIQVEITDPPCDVFQTIYYPDLTVPYYRASITGNVLIVEFNQEPDDVVEILDEVAEDLGLTPMRYRGPAFPKCHRYGKITPINEELRREFIYTLTREYGIYSLGRFATWRQIILDDVAKDCEVIDRLIRSEVSRVRYAHSLALTR